MSANVESMFYAGREKPWHGLGTQVEEAPTSADALRLAGLDWTVQRKPIQVCGGRRVPEDGREPRPNLIFQLGDQTEKVVYDDWNGVAAYKDQFNKNFREKVSK